MEAEEKHKEFIKQVSSYLSGEMSPEEQARFMEEIRNEPVKQDLLDSSRKIWDSAVRESSYDLDAEWALMKGKLPDFDRTSVTGEPTGRLRTLQYYAYRIAAVLVLGLVLGFSWVYVTRMMGMVRVLAKEDPVELILDDGTEVTVNRDSKLRYSKKFASSERMVYLSGEAFFKVARDTSMPFVVDAGTALVEVLGTSFNVNAYRDNPTVEITVASGLVALSSKDDQEDQIVMKAGSGGSYDKSRGALKLIATPDPNNLSWRTRELYFDSATLQEVADVVGRVYGVDIRIMDRELASCLITVTFKDQTLEAILRVLELTLDLELTRSGNVISLDGEGCTE